MICPRYGWRMRVVAFLTDHAVVNRIIRHQELTFAAQRPPPAYVHEQTALISAEVRKTAAPAPPDEEPPRRFD